MNLKPLLIIPPIAIGVLGFMWMTQAEEKTTAPPEEIKLAVRAIQVTAEPLTLTATGFGRVEAVRNWSAVSQAEGRVVETLPGLAVGTLVEAGELLIQIDKTDYEIAIAKSKANIASAEATLSEIDRQEENTQRLLELEQRVFEVSKAEFERTQKLSQSGTVTSATLDTAQKNLLNQENAIVNLKNTLALYPSQRASAEASLSVRQAELSEAERGLKNTTIIAPFKGRISSKSIETGQFVRLGNELLQLDAVDKAEIVGAFQPQTFGNLMRAAVGPKLQNVAQIDATRVIDYMKQGDIKAYVTSESFGSIARYDAEPVRFRGSIDSETGTLGIIVTVDDPLLSKPQQARPPLEFGTFVSVVLEATPEAPVIAIPRAILQQNGEGKPFVYTADTNDQLAQTLVTPDAIAGDNIIISQGLTDGDRILLSAPRPSVPGVGLSVTIVDGQGK